MLRRYRRIVHTLASACLLLVLLMLLNNELPHQATTPHHQIELKSEVVTRKEETTSIPEFVIVVCGDGKSEAGKIGDSYQRQLRHVSVLLKSAAALTSQTLRFNVVCDSFSTYGDVMNLTYNWPSKYRRRIDFGDYKKIFYPTGTESMRNMFRPCATQRLFLAQVFDKKDAVVFLDTDILFHMPPEDLWWHISNFTTQQVIGIAPCLYYYGPRFKKFPTYGTSGLNAGVLLMNLTRIRSFEGGWTESIMKIVRKYGKKLILADQDILNNFFSNKTTAEHLYELGCEWNYRPKVCSLGQSSCKQAETVGVGAMHGAALTFVNNVEPKFKAVYKAWEQHQLGDSLDVFAKHLNTTLRQQKISKGCSKIKFINDILLQGLQNTLKRKERNT